MATFPMSTAALTAHFLSTTASSTRPESTPAWTTQPTSTATASTNPVSTTAPRLYGDDTGTQRFRQPFYDTNVQQQPRSTAPPTSDPANTLALAISRLAVANESVTLPKSEIIKFDGSARNFQRFLTSFDHNIGSKPIDESAKLTYLIQYCEGKARSLIEDCVMMDPDQGYAEARHLLRKEYAKPHEIARSCIDSLTKGPAIAANDYEAIIDLAREMQRCRLTLTQINYMSDLQSSQTMYAILRRLPDFLQQKWMDKNVWFDKFNREPTFDDFLDFMQDRAAAYKTSVGQEVLRQKQDRKKAQKSDTEVKKKKPEKPSRTLATTAAATTPSTSNEKPTSTPSSSTTRS